MISTSLWPLHKAIYARLSTDSDLLAIATGVHDAVEEGLIFPYITIGAPTTLNLDTRTSFSEEVSIVIHSWSTYSGKKESYELLNAITHTIGKGLSIEGPFSLRKVEKPTMQVIDDLDARIKHGMARFTFTIQNK